MSEEIVKRTLEDIPEETNDDQVVEHICLSVNTVDRNMVKPEPFFLRESDFNNEAKHNEITEENILGKSQACSESLEATNHGELKILSSRIVKSENSERDQVGKVACEEKGIKQRIQFWEMQSEKKNSRGPMKSASSGRLVQPREYSHYALDKEIETYRKENCSLVQTVTRYKNIFEILKTKNNILLNHIHRLSACNCSVGQAKGKLCERFEQEKKLINNKLHSHKCEMEIIQKYLTNMEKVNSQYDIIEKKMSNMRF